MADYYQSVQVEQDSQRGVCVWGGVFQHTCYWKQLTCPPKTSWKELAQKVCEQSFELLFFLAGLPQRSD